MAEGSYRRKLASVFSADVVGYSRLMGEDEAATVRTLEVYKAVMSELIRQHRGRVVDSPGDNVLAVFARPACRIEAEGRGRQVSVFPPSGQDQEGLS